MNDHTPFTGDCRQRADSSFSFLFGGAGTDYYKWRLESLTVTARAAPPPAAQRPRPLDADDRGAILGEQARGPQIPPVPFAFHCASPCWLQRRHPSWHRSCRAAVAERRM